MTRLWWLPGRKRNPDRHPGIQFTQRAVAAEDPEQRESMETGAHLPDEGSDRSSRLSAATGPRILVWHSVSGRGSGRHRPRTTIVKLSQTALTAVLGAAIFACGGPPAEQDDPAAVAEPTTGRWTKFRTHRYDPDLTAEQREEIERLESLGYASGSTPAPQERDVIHYDRDRAWPGLNLYTSGHAPEALLIDMEGRVLHRWRHEFREVWEDFPVGDELASTTFWRRARVYPNGDLLAIFDGLGLIKIDRDSQLLWSHPGREHHDLEMMQDGRIYVLTREARLVPRIPIDQPILEDFISILTPDGEEVERISIFEAFENSPYWERWQEKMARARYTLGANTIEVLDGRIADRAPAFGAGNVLVSLLTVDTIGVIDLEQRRFVWARTGGYVAQHDPTVLPNGNLMLFDNQGHKGRSRVFEVDPVDGQVAWLYADSPEHPFFSRTCGTAQRLPNGNTLITESDGGRAFEVTPGEEIVWEFSNPHRAGTDGEYIATLFELLRLPADFPADWAETDAPR